MKSILPASILKIEPGAVGSGMGSTSTKGRTLSAGAYVTFHQKKDRGIYLTVRVEVWRARQSPPLAQQAQQQAVNGVYERTYQTFWTTRAEAEDDAKLKAALDACPKHRIAFEKTDSGSSFRAIHSRVSIAGKQRLGYDVKVVGVSDKGVTFLVTVQRDGHVLQADTIQVADDQTEVFWVTPKVDFLGSKQPSHEAGVAVRVRFRE